MGVKGLQIIADPLRHWRFGDWRLGDWIGEWVIGDWRFGGDFANARFVWRLGRLSPDHAACLQLTIAQSPMIARSPIAQSPMVCPLLPDGGLEELAGGEAHHAALWDLDGGAGSRIPCHARAALRGLERPEPDK